MEKQYAKLTFADMQYRFGLRLKKTIHIRYSAILTKIQAHRLIFLV